MGEGGCSLWGYKAGLATDGVEVRLKVCVCVCMVCQWRRDELYCIHSSILSQHFELNVKTVLTKENPFVFHIIIFIKFYVISLITQNELSVRANLGYN